LNLNGTGIPHLTAILFIPIIRLVPSLKYEIKSNKSLQCSNNLAHSPKRQKKNKEKGLEEKK
jgi:hypothetical protein